MFNGIAATESLKMLQKQSVEYTLSRTQLFRWHKALCESREVIEKLPIPPRLMTITSKKLKKQRLHIVMPISEIQQMISTTLVDRLNTFQLMIWIKKICIKIPGFDSPVHIRSEGIHIDPCIHAICVQVHFLSSLKIVYMISLWQAKFFLIRLPFSKPNPALLRTQLTCNET